ncbi:MAG: type I polyketide synthase [Rhodocyclaceae bacterium]|nr:type I polyketide synthase [Rhodocyclaceae bacterium]
MSAPRNDSPDLQRQALEALRRMRERVEQMEAARTEPLAIVGLGCRLPGAPDPEAFWELLRTGGDAIRDIPSERWDAARHSPADINVVHKAGLLDRVDGFDAEFFGIAGREAQLMDPQQRLFLEVTWEALECAGIPPSSLKGTRTGVFVGTTTSDYLHLLTRRLRDSELDAYIVSGNTLNATAGRVSFTLGLQGPAIAMDTACSSSLVAVDRACRSVRDGESRMAIAGGVNLILSPEVLLCLARWGMLSPDAHCKTFDASANGFVRAEGCGVILIKRLSTALADGDRVIALIRGSAVNQDGPSSGFAVPNGLAQIDVMRDALTASGLSPDAVGYIEAHGTGTTLGDPIEMDGIATVYGADRSRPLVVGAVKSNVGHLEAAAGVTGLIKTVLALAHRQIPPNVNFRVPTPHIPWADIPVRVPTTLEPWEPIKGRRIAGVSSFGFSGTNAHVILEEAPQPQAAANMAAAAPAPHLITLSARSPAALDALANLYAARLERDGADVALIGPAGAAGRAHMPYRLSVTGPDANALVVSLRTAARGEDCAELRRARIAVASNAGVAFLFTGQGAQYAGMGRELAKASPVFRDALERCAAAIDTELGGSLLEVMFAPGEENAPLDETRYTQPALFAIQYALVELWRSVGITPSVVLGHSVGEFAAACCAGVMSLDDAAKLVTLRGRLMQELPDGGAMAAVFTCESAVKDTIARIPGVVVVAGINGPDETVVSGETAAVQATIAAFAKEGVRAEPMKVSHAFHSPLMRPMLAAFERAAGGVTRAAPEVRIISSMTGRVADAEWGSAKYWIEQLQSPVRYADAIRTAVESGIAAALEIGPHPVLAALGHRSLPDADIAWFSSLRRGRDDWTTWLGTLGDLYVRGVVDDWSGVERRAVRARVELPRYPFQRARYWVDEPKGADAPSGPATRTWRHPLLGWRVPVATGDAIFETAAGDSAHAVLREHSFNGRSVWPATASAEMMLAASRELAPNMACELRDLEFRAPLILSAEGSVTVQTVLRSAGRGAWSAEILRAPPGDGGAWLVIAAARVEAHLPGEAARATEREESIRSRLSDEVDPQAFYAGLAARGAQFGPAFRSLDSIRCAEGEAMGRVRLPSSTANGFILHPVLLDGCLQLASVAAGDRGASAEPLYFPTHAGRLAVFGNSGAVVWCHVTVRRKPEAPRALWAELSVWNEDGTPVARLDDVRFERVSPAALGLVPAGLVERAGYELVWREVAAEAAAPSTKRWLVVPDRSGSGESLVRVLRERGDAVAMMSVDDASRDSAEVARALDAIAVTLGGLPEAVVHLAGLDAPATTDGASASAGVRSMLQSALHLAQACVRIYGQRSARLWLVTRGAQAVRPGEGASPAGAALWGFGRVVRAEHPELSCSMLDLDARASVQDIVAVVDSIDPAESLVAVRAGQAWTARLAPLREAGEFRLTVPRPGSIDDVALEAFEPRVPGPGEVRIEVCASGLNFRDVLCALGMYPGKVAALGGECAGVVSAVGPDVNSLAPGDEVIALAPESLATSVVVPERFAVRRPASITEEQGAGLTVAYLTASYALERLASLKRGERVLIHSAAGGVGMAAVRIAQLIGADVFATASESKRDLVRAAGVRHVFDSRSLTFRDEILDATGGAGVDVVLNALAGEFIPASLALLKPGGRFLEMGKRDIYSSAEATRLYPGINYKAFDLADDALRDPSLAPTLFAILLQRLESGALEPLPVTVHPLEAPHAAFEAMVHARHTGKLVLRRYAPRPRTVSIDPNANYLVTGGFGALGLAVAEGLAARGARHLVLMGRRPPAPKARNVLQVLAARGVSIREVLCDIGDPSVCEIIAGIAAREPKLRGVVHAAGVLDDGVLAHLDWPRFEKALRPKLAGALNLATATERKALDFFVLFSAGAAWLGNPGQANYAAANSTLDALAHSLSSAGRAVTSIAWGRWAGDGMAGAHGTGGRGWSALGVGEIVVEEGISAMFRLVERGVPVSAVIPMDWARYLGAVYGNSPPRFFADVLKTPVAEAAHGSTLVADLLATPANQRHAALVGRLEALVRKVVGVPAQRRIEPNLPVRDLGMDSLMTVELKNAISRAVECTLPATLVFDHPTLESLAAYLMSVIPQLVPEAVPTEATPDGAAAEVRAMSETEAEAELLRELQHEARP